MFHKLIRIISYCFLALFTLAVHAEKCPVYEVLRFKENWSVLKDEVSPDEWTALKYQPLNRDGSYWMSLGGQMRDRIEGWDNFGFNAANDDTYNLWRLVAHADIHFKETWRFFIEGKSALSSNRDLPGGTRTLDRDDLALQQAFVDLNVSLAHDSRLTIRPGRRELLFGAQRLVSPLPWSNTMRTWDGVSMIYKNPQWTSTAFYTHFVPVKKTKFNSSTNDQLFSGVYSTWKMPKTTAQMDLYWLSLDRLRQLFAGPNGTAQIAKGNTNTIGSRLFGQLSSSEMSYDLEAAYQFGDFGQKTISAFMFASILNYPLKTIKLNPVVFGGFDYASGGNPSSSKQKTFNQLYPLGHKYYGLMDIIGRQNAVDLHGGSSVKLWPKGQVAFDYHQFWLANSNDALYSPGGAIVRKSGTNRCSHIGAELDTYITHTFGCHLFALFGYNHFFPGQFIRQTGPDKSINFTYLQLTYIV